MPPGLVYLLLDQLSAMTIRLPYIEGTIRWIPVANGLDTHEQEDETGACGVPLRWRPLRSLAVAYGGKLAVAHTGDSDDTPVELAARERVERRARRSSSVERDVQAAVAVASDRDLDLLDHPKLRRDAPAQRSPPQRTGVCPYSGRRGAGGKRAPFCTPPPRLP